MGWRRHWQPTIRTCLKVENTPPSMQYSYGMTFILLWQTNSSLQNSLAPEIISFGSTKNSNGLLDKETELFRNIGNQVNMLIEKFLDLKQLFRKSFKLSNQSYLEDILDVASNDHTSEPNTIFFLNFYIPYKILPLLHLYANKILSIRTTPQKPLF